MSDRSHPFRLFERWRRRSGDSLISEPADMGTAFGLDLSMLPTEPPAPAAAAMPAARPRWWQRLTRWQTG